MEACGHCRKLEIFDLKDDPLEKINIAERYPALLVNLHFELDKAKERQVKIKKSDQSLFEQLESLGYLK